MKQLSLIAMVCIILLSCTTKRATPIKSKPLPAYSTEAHRGGRGIMPENTIMAMLNAVDLGVTTLEMDAHITQDKQVVLAHDHYINRGFSLDANGKEIPENEAKSHLLYGMNYNQIRKYDIGSKTNVGFPQQMNIEAHIPLLNDLIDSVQRHLKQTHKKQVFYNIETKSNIDGDGLWHPNPEEFVDLLVQVIESKNITPWVTIQSFDVRTLQVLKKKYPYIRTSYLVSKGNLSDNLQILGFTPDIYSPAYKIVDKELIKECHIKNMKIIPWTVNTLEEINELKAMGVDGIISDFPNILN